MGSAFELYKQIYREVDDINKRIKLAEENVESIKAGSRADIPARIAHYEEVIEKIDDYTLKVRAFQEQAKKNLDSMNVLTIEAPPDYRVNLNRLANWAYMIDPRSENDPYAQRVYAVAKCDELFLEKKRDEFTCRIAELKSDQVSGLTAEMAEAEAEIKRLYDERNKALDEEKIKSLTEELLKEHDQFRYYSSPENYAPDTIAPDNYSLGSIGYLFDFGTEKEGILLESFGEYYDQDEDSLFFPLLVDANKENIITVTCAPARSRHLDRALQHFVLQQIDRNAPGTRKVFALDAVRYNSSGMGSLRQIENTFALDDIPRNPEQLTSELEQIVSTFGDIDEVIDLSDSIREYNMANPDRKPLTYLTLILYGWPNAFSARDRELIMRILSNYERYGVSAVVINYQASEKKADSVFEDMPEYALYNAIHIKMLSKRTSVRLPEEDGEKLFKWYSFDEELTPTYAASLKENAVSEDLTGNDYLKRYDMKEIPKYTRGYTPIILPFGVDGKDQEQSISFDKNNFAAYLIGDSGSGKSTLIHTIIAGILRNYHPDDVELWLADFKQVEFKQYIDHRPPHVKYILLDESHELVYDLIDKLNDEMLARQQLLAKLGKEKVEEIEIGKETDRPVPIIFVIMDEFSIMSQAIDADQSYRLKLQNLLAKGRALGFKFLFASQKFTSGVTGLTATAKDQIQQRISMKAPKDEINEVLALSPNLRTEKVRNWIDAIPPYYALIKRRIDDNTLEVNRMKVMYFSDGYESRDKMIDGIAAQMKKVENLAISESNTYVDKDPVIVDGNSYDAFNIDKTKAALNHVDKDEGDIVLALGTPRLMSKIKPVVLSTESRENMLLVGRSAEHPCVSSIIMTACKTAKDQNADVCIWSYEKDRLFKQYRDLFEQEGIRIVTGMEAICHEIEEIRNRLKAGVPSSEIIILLGMDRICGDFEYSDEMTTAFKMYSNERSEEEQQQIDSHSFEMAVREKLSEIQREGRAAGKSDEEIKALKIATKEQMEKEAGITVEKTTEAPSDANPDEQKDKSEFKPMEAFREIVRNGSRQGIHFILCLNSMSDFRVTGLRQELFRHKATFQLSEDDSIALFGKKVASQLSEHVCLYDDSYERYSFRPYLHKEIIWDGWSVNDDNEAVSPLNS